jgi:hypothetical protein
MAMNKKQTQKKLKTAYINQNPQDYFNLIADRSGLGTGGGVQPFHDWVRTSGYEQAARGYSNRLLDNKKLTFQKYMKNSYGVPTRKSAFTPRQDRTRFRKIPPGMDKRLMRTLPNPRYAGGKGRNAGEAVGIARKPGPFNTFADAMRQQFLRLTPEQSGTYNAAYGMGPSRWSVFG